MRRRQSRPLADIAAGRFRSRCKWIFQVGGWNTTSNAQCVFVAGLGGILSRSQSTNGIYRTGGGRAIVEIKRGKLTKPRKCLVYGPQGIGKTTLCKGTLLLDIEGGSGDQDLARIDLSGVDYAGFVACLGELFEMDFDEPTVSVDTLDWLGKLIANNVERTYSKEDRSYGKDKALVESKWEYLRRGFEKLQNEKGKNLLFLAHERMEKVRPTDSAEYQRYAPDLDCDLIPEWCDDILFYRYRIVTREEDAGFNKVRNVAVPTRIRYLQTTWTPGAVAKNRLGLPDEIESFETYRAFLAKGN